MVRTTMLAIAGCLVIVTAAISRAQEPPPSDVTGDSTSIAATAPASTATTPPTVEPTVELPTPDNTPLPPTATPQLPEEGGPPGGVLGGYVYTDADGSLSRTSGDHPVDRPSVSVWQFNADGSRRFFAAPSDSLGHWELRGLPDGEYHVLYAPAFRDPAFEAHTIPPMEPITLNPNTTFDAMVHRVEIVDANRILNLDFGLPLEPPAVGGQPIALPSTGTGDGGRVQLWLLGGMIGACALGVVALAYRRVRR